MALRDRLQSLPPLHAALTEEDNDFLLINPSGQWSTEKFGRLRPRGDLPIPLLHVLTREIEASTEPLQYQGWRFECLESGQGKVLVAERSPTLDHSPPCSSTALEIITASLQAQENGLVIGPPGTGKLAFFCWMLQAQDGPGVLVSETPPQAIERDDLLHLFPPRDLAGFRRLARLLRRMPLVLWDRVSSRADLRAAIGFEGACVRWISLDAASAADAEARLASLSQDTPRCEFSTMVVFQGGRRQMPELKQVFARDQQGRWREVFGPGADAVEATELLDGLQSSPSSSGERATLRSAERADRNSTLENPPLDELAELDDATTELRRSQILQKTEREPQPLSAAPPAVEPYDDTTDTREREQPTVSILDDLNTTEHDALKPGRDLPFDDESDDEIVVQEIAAADDPRTTLDALLDEIQHDGLVDVPEATHDQQYDPGDFLDDFDDFDDFDDYDDLDDYDQDPEVEVIDMGSSGLPEIEEEPVDGLAPPSAVIKKKKVRHVEERDLALHSYFDESSAAEESYPELQALSQDAITNNIPSGAIDELMPEMREDITVLRSQMPEDELRVTIEGEAYSRKLALQDQLSESTIENLQVRDDLRQATDEQETVAVIIDENWPAEDVEPQTAEFDPDEETDLEFEALLAGIEDAHPEELLRHPDAQGPHNSSPHPSSPPSSPAPISPPSSPPAAPSPSQSSPGQSQQEYSVSAITDRGISGETTTQDHPTRETTPDPSLTAAREQRAMDVQDERKLSDALEKLKARLKSRE